MDYSKYTKNHGSQGGDYTQYLQSYAGDSSKYMQGQGSQARRSSKKWVLNLTGSNFSCRSGLTNPSRHCGD